MLADQAQFVLPLSPPHPLPILPTPFVGHAWPASLALQHLGLGLGRFCSCLSQQHPLPLAKAHGGFGQCV